MYSGGWKLIDAEFRRKSTNKKQILPFELPALQFSKKTKKPTEQTCYNIHDRTFGSFGVIYNKNIIEPILNWMDDPRFNHKPFDHVFQYLSRLGYIVRVSYPNIIVSDIRHESSVDNTRINKENLKERAKEFRWNTENFLFDF